MHCHRQVVQIFRNAIKFAWSPEVVVSAEACLERFEQVWAEKRLPLPVVAGGTAEGVVVADAARAPQQTPAASECSLRPRLPRRRQTRAVSLAERDITVRVEFTPLGADKRDPPVLIEEKEARNRA